MYGVPDKQRLMRFIGKALIQICIGSHQVILQFEDNLSISVETKIEHDIPDEGARHYNEYWKQDTSLSRLLGARIDDIDVILSRRLCLKFSNEHSISVDDDSNEYEAMAIRIDGDLIIV